jgi:hypothetical protein
VVIFIICLLFIFGYMNNAEILAQLSPEELQNLLAVAQNIKPDGTQVFELPSQIQNELDSNHTKEQQNLNARFIRRLRNYEGNQWTRGGATNKELIAELKRSNVDANQLVQQMYKDAEKLRHTARAAAELFEDIDIILEQDDPTTAGQQLVALQQKCKTIAIYGFSTSKQLDNDARKTTTAAIKLPATMRYIAETETEDKDLAFSQEDMERLHQERFQERLLQQSATRRGHGHAFGRQRGGRNPAFGRPQQQHQQKSFFGRPRPQHQNQQSNNPFRGNTSQSTQPVQHQDQ